MTILRIARNVSNLDHLTTFYAALGFQPLSPAQDNAALAAMLGVANAKSTCLTLGLCEIELTQTDPPGAPYPSHADASSRLFQHIAMLTPDIVAAASRALAAGAAAISVGGPVQLPADSGGAVAWKFRDPDLHPIEFLQHRDQIGYDHSGIVVVDSKISAEFYRRLGLHKVYDQTNMGPEQARLDGLEGAAPHITTLRAASGPGLELLNYGSTHTSAFSFASAPADIAADRLVIAGVRPGLLRDPDGHWVAVEAQPST
ncbi:VOC family protein [Acidocella sp.]|uniref:VOC family protein n=1 Tax=Acidocella sp. TaxID=50710 RepID=UPI00261CEA44|nr:VOC family protein [Acidocella sp.]